MDHYKSMLKDKLKGWLSTVQERQAEWLVLYLPLGTSSSRFESSSKTYRKIFDKIKGDFKVPEHRLLKYDLVRFFNSGPSAFAVISLLCVGMRARVSRARACARACSPSVVCEC